MKYNMKYIRKINEYNNNNNGSGSFADTFTKLTQNLIFDRLGKVKFDFHDGNKLYKKDTSETSQAIVMVRLDSKHGRETTGRNDHEKENSNIEYRYSTEFSKYFKILDKNLIDKQIKIYEKKLELIDIVIDIKSKLKDLTYYCDLKIINGGKNFISIRITMGFSEDMFMGNAMRQVNKS